MNDFCDTKTACQILGCSATSLLRYRNEGKLLENIHYGRNPGGRIVMYNIELLNHLVSVATCNHKRSDLQSRLL